MRKSLFVLSAALILGLAGCASRETPMPPAPKPSAPSAPSTVQDKRVSADPAFNAIARVINVSEGPGSAGFLRVEFQVQNTTSSLQRVGYRIEWTDRNGVPVDVPTPTPPMTLLANETAPIVALAPSPIATSFRVNFFPVNQ